jgi:hypothetical protein
MRAELALQHLDQLAVYLRHSVRELGAIAKATMQDIQMRKSAIHGEFNGLCFIPDPALRIDSAGPSWAVSIGRFSFTDIAVVSIFSVSAVRAT